MQDYTSFSFEQWNKWTAFGIPISRFLNKQDSLSIVEGRPPLYESYYYVKFQVSFAKSSTW